MALRGWTVCGHHLRVQVAKWRINAPAVFHGVRHLSYVPVDDEVAGLTDDQSQVSLYMGSGYHKNW